MVYAKGSDGVITSINNSSGTAVSTPTQWLGDPLVLETVNAQLLRWKNTNGSYYCWTLDQN